MGNTESTPARPPQTARAPWGAPSPHSPYRSRPQSVREDHTPREEQVQETFGEEPLRPSLQLEPEMPGAAPSLPVQEAVAQEPVHPSPQEALEMPGGSHPLPPEATSPEDTNGAKVETNAPHIEAAETQLEPSPHTESEAHSPKPSEQPEPPATAEKPAKPRIQGVYTPVSLTSDSIPAAAAMDLSGGDHKSVISFPLHGGLNQQWSFMPLTNGPEGSYTIRSRGGGVYLTVEPDLRGGVLKVVATEFPASWVVAEIDWEGLREERVISIGWPKSALAVGFAEGEGGEPGHKVQLVESNPDHADARYLWRLVPSAAEHDDQDSKHSDWHIGHRRSQTESTAVGAQEDKTGASLHKTTPGASGWTETVVSTTTTTTVQTTKEGTVITTVTKVAENGNGGRRSERGPAGSCVLQ
ncbi:hypothetical protein GLOTRDRAFT_95070 [Gloeophyllum trabeum ATCC 11539]|uniref:Ricin B lectin domain-containing protein n=1 Tax=Gloeophyllum trabeum (strain ATCC 11539 / FP-39264 / Madison 617) TaxID=670483 RepID=S7RFR6_GLOTA|nr:uncharacterized protein GLOTRDRAFT_95070 [Gloeophyllum trabeum ATCC 11539]EPQ53020.1 hypothetical protein GLOTRDRAFT_95070 [Gloeophyllum trabeum ATCC 11539]